MVDKTNKVEDKGFFGSLKSLDFSGMVGTINHSRGRVGGLAGFAYGWSQGGFGTALKYALVGAIAGQLSNIVLKPDTVKSWTDGGKEAAAEQSSKAPVKVEDKSVEKATEAEKAANKARAEQHVKDEALKNKDIAIADLEKNHTAENLSQEQIDAKLDKIIESNEALGITGKEVEKGKVAVSQPNVIANESEVGEKAVG